MTTIPAVLDELDRLHMRIRPNHTPPSSTDSFFEAILNAYPRLAAELRLARAVAEKAGEYRDGVDDVGTGEAYQQWRAMVEAIAAWRAAQEEPKQPN